jgi:RNA polymerase sigma factor (sigma-70 family)
MSAGLLSYLRHVLPSTEAALADGELLRRFIASREQAAFAELLRRHGALVWGTCRRVLGDAHAAEDAFQATFLRLAQRAGTLQRDGSLAGWLHTVATRMSRRAWRAETRRRRRDREYVPPTAVPADDLTWRELRQILDAEIARLPEPYRQPLILCYLENQSQIEAAHRLGLTPSALRGRLERGRQKLRRRLEKLGLPLAAALLLTKADPVPAALSQTTLRTVSNALLGGPVPPAVAALAAGGTLLARLKLGVVAAVLLLAGGFGIGGADRRVTPANEPPPKEPPAKARAGVDALGDRLPPGALQRLGTRRHRVQDWPLPWHDLPDGKSYLAYQSLGIATNEIRRINAQTGRILETWRVPEMRDAVAFTPDGRCVLLSNNFVFYTGLRVPGQKEEQQWELTLFDLTKRKAVWTQHEMLERINWKYVQSVQFSADGKWIATTAPNGMGVLRLWDAASGKEMWHQKPKSPWMEPLGFADSSKVLVTCGDDNTIYLLDRATGKQIRSFPTMPRKETQRWGLSPDGSAVLFGRYGPTLRVWDVATGKEKAALEGHKEWARRFAFSPDGKTLVTGGNDTFALVREWLSGKVVRRIELGRSGVSRMTVSGDGRQLEVLFWGEQALHFYDLKTSKERRTALDGHHGSVYGVALAPDGTLLSYGKDAAVHTWDVKKGQSIDRLRVEQNLNGGSLAVSHDGRLIAVPNGDNKAIQVYDRATGFRMRKFPAQRDVGKHSVFSPDRRWLAGVDTSEGIIQVWEVNTGREVLQLANRVVYGVTCAFSPNGEQFAATGEGVVRFWDTRTWKERSGLKAYAPLGLAYSPDGRSLATAGVEGVHLFELATRRERFHVRPAGYPSRGLLFSPSGRWLAWPSDSRTIHVCDARRGEMLGSFMGHDDTITGLAFTADERSLVSSSNDSTLLVWDVSALVANQKPDKSGDFERAWPVLAGEDAKAAFQAIRELAATPEATVKRLARQLKPIAPIDAKRIEACLCDLDSSEFEVRERATRELEGFGDLATAALERFLASRPALEPRRRAEQVLEKTRDTLPHAERLRQMRALEVLERIGDSEAQRLLEKLAKGAAEARLTRDAKAVLGRMRR